jgi:PadR family transcriptional regulator, regulatory protein PadR
LYKLNKNLKVMNVENTKAQMRKGVLELCILGIVSQKEVYPSDIIEELKSAQLIVVEGTLYPLLSRLKNAGLLDYYWKESNMGPPRKYYTITELGKEFYTQLTLTWQELEKAVNQSLKILKNHE